MTFTDEPSIIIPGRFSVRIEDIVVCEEGGGRQAQRLPRRSRRESSSRYFGDICVTSIEYTAL